MEGIIQMKVSVKKLRENATIPTRGSEQAAGYDLYACIDAAVTIKPHTTEKIGTGLAFAVPDGYFGAIFARSGLAAKQGLRPANCVGVADSDYRGEVCVGLCNVSDKPYVIEPDERVAQMVIAPVLTPEIVEVEELSDTNRGAGGFGSTGR